VVFASISALAIVASFWIWACSIAVFEVISACDIVASFWIWALAISPLTSICLYIRPAPLYKANTLNPKRKVFALFFLPTT